MVLSDVVTLCNESETGDYGSLENITRIVMIGSGIKTYSHLTAKVFDHFKEQKIRIHMISSSEMSLSIYVETHQASQAMSVLNQMITERG